MQTAQGVPDGPNRNTPDLVRHQMVHRRRHQGRILRRMDLPPIAQREPTRWDSQPNTIQHLHGQVRQVRGTHTHPSIYTGGPTARQSPIRTSDTPGRISPEKGQPRKGTSTTEGSTTPSLPRPQRSGI